MLFYRKWIIFKAVKAVVNVTNTSAESQEIDSTEGLIRRTHDADFLSTISAQMCARSVQNSKHIVAVMDDNEAPIAAPL